MQVPLQITMREVDHSEAVKERIRQKVEKLNVFSDKIIACHVVVEQDQAHRQHGHLYNVRIVVTLPQKKELVVNKNEQENLYLAIREAFDDMVRQVEDANHRMQGDIKTHSPLLTGHIARLFDEEQFGFIVNGYGEEYYFNINHLLNTEFTKLKVGTPVQFIAAMGDEGPQATKVRAKHQGSQ